MSITVLDPTKLNLSVMGMRIEGFSKGAFITISSDAPKFQIRESLKGTSCVIRNKSKSRHTLTFRLQNTGASNTWLHTIHNIQKSYGAVFPVPVQYKDLNGVTTTLFCPSAIVQNITLGQGDDVEEIEWTLECPNTYFVFGGTEENGKIVDALQKFSSVLSTIDFLNIDMSDVLNQATKIKDNLVGKLGGLF